ncbi:ribonuclease H-like domain-containing protein [Tanacetum coccineum]
MMTRKLCNIDCRVLIDNVKKRIFDWKNKYLWYVGKLQLIAYVLSSLIVYWDSMFVLPNHICLSIDKILKDFLWSFDEGRRGFTSVAWKDICSPKNQGGLGLRSIKLMNEGLMIKHLWNVVSKNDSLWVKWVNSYRLKGKCIWSLSMSDNAAYCWRNILKLRDKIRDFVGSKIGNGKSCYIWFDKWHSKGPLCKNFKDVLDVPVPVLNDLEDKTIWFNKKFEEVDFSMKVVCSVLRVDIPSVLWHKHVWYTQCIPRHAFILWLALRGRLKTQDRLSKWVKILNKLDGVSIIWAEVVSGIQDYALWEVIENGDSWVLVPQIAQENGTSVTKMSILVTAEEKTNKKNEVKARSLLLMALPNEYQLTFTTKKTQKTLLKQQYENFSASSAASLDSIFNRLQKIVSRLAILVVWRNKPEVKTMSIDYLYNNFKIVEQKVKKSVGASSGAQNLAFMTAPSTSSTNDANTTSPQVSTASPNVNAASPQVSTASVSDNTVYAFMVEIPNGYNVLHQDLEQIHEDD